MQLAVLLLVANLAISNASPLTAINAQQKKCIVKEKASGEQKECAFPFVIGNKTHDSCTDHKDPDGKRWCSTKTSHHSLSPNVHEGGKGLWGYCSEDCIHFGETTTTTTITTTTTTTTNYYYSYSCMYQY